MNVSPEERNSQDKVERCGMEKGPAGGTCGSPGTGHRKSLPGKGQEEDGSENRKLGDRKLGHLPCETKRVLSDKGQVP